MSWRSQVSRNLQSIKLLACSTAPSHAAARDWYFKAYTELKHLNPRFPFLIRQNPDPSPYLFVEYDFGRKVKVDLAGLSEEEIDNKIKDAVIAGNDMPRAYYQSVAPFQLPTVID